MFAAVVFDLNAAEDIMRDIGVLESLLESDPFLSAEQARHIMGELEDKFALAHAHAMVQRSDPGARLIFELLANQDRANAELLHGSK